MTPPIQIIDHRYRLVRAIGKGMSGQVLLVADNDGEKALKLLNPLQMNVSRDEALANFKNEFGILKNLGHPNISRILDFGYDELLRKYYFTTEFISGQELLKACMGLTINEIEKLVVQVLRALNYLHSRGIYHFDIKPQNVLVTMEGRIPTAKLIDFGLAGYASPRKKVGTPSYMAPEAAQGGMLDGRTDLYSFGVVIYKLMTGENPFFNKDVKKTLANQIHLTPDSPSRHHAAVPEYWDHILGRLLEKDPAHRYSQAAFVIRDLGFLSHKIIDIETDDTKLSYLPERGALIGREEQWRSFTALFGDVFLSDAATEAKLFIVEGGKGTGKSRLLSELKSYSQLRNVPVINFEEGMVLADIPKRFLLMLDESSVSTDEVNALFQSVSGMACLIVWAVEQAQKNWTGGVLARLDNYTPAQLKQYIESVTGLESAPERVIDEIHKRTQGNPLFVTEFVKSLLKQDVLYDAGGKWDARTFEDIEIDFDRIIMPVSMEEHSRARLATLAPGETEILKWLALSEVPLSYERLGALTGSHSLTEELARLCDANIIESSPREGTCRFKNRMIAGIMTNLVPPGELASRHLRLAEIFTGDASTRKAYLFHTGFGSFGAKAKDALEELGNTYLVEARYDKAKTIYQGLIALGDAVVEWKWRLNLGKALAGLSDYEGAIRECSHLVSSSEHHLCSDAALEVYQHLIDVTLKRADIADAEKNMASAHAYCEAAASHLEKSERRRMWEVVLKNYRAYLDFKYGASETALQSFRETYELWRSSLSEEEQPLVNNNRLVEMFLFKRDYEAAARVCRESITIQEKLGDKAQLMVSRYMLGGVYYHMLMDGKGQEAQELAEKCIYNFQCCEQSARAIKNYSYMLRAFNGIGMLYLSRGDPDKALEYYRRALAVSRKAGELETAGFISYNIATIHKDVGNPREAYSHLVYAINTFEGLAFISTYSEFILYLAYLVLADVNLRMDKPEKCRRTLEHADRILARNDLAKASHFRRSLVSAQLYFYLGATADGEKVLVEAKLQAITSEQKLIVSKYVASPEYKRARRNLPINMANVTPPTIDSSRKEKGHTTHSTVFLPTEF